MVRLALALALANKPEPAAETLQQLITAFPNSPWRPLADHLLQLGSAMRQLEVASADRENLLAFYRTQLDSLRAAATPAAPDPDRFRRELASRDERIRRLSAEIEELEERIRRLTAELENLRKIDLQRRRPR
jgi:predicted RNase H-like nuclease (RuvC/YqgF family)